MFILFGLTALIADSVCCLETCSKYVQTLFVQDDGRRELVANMSFDDELYAIVLGVQMLKKSLHVRPSI